MTQPKNVIFVMTDQQHYRTLGCNGTTEAHTPNIDRLAARGVRFDNHFVTNPVCSPSRGSIITGRYPSESGLWCNGCSLPEPSPTIPKAMSEAGFQTAHFGKLHLVPIIKRVGAHPSYGFDVCEVAEGDQQLTHDSYFSWLRQTAPNQFVSYLQEMYAGGHANAYTSKLPEELHMTSWVTDRATDWLANRRDPNHPFYLSVGYFDPHHAWNPVEPYASQFAHADVPDPVYREGEHEKRPESYRNFFKGCSTITRDEERMRAIIRANHAMCAHIDACIGKLVASLEELGLSDDTVVIFTSDHGELLGNHGLLWKGPYMLDDLLRVPLVVAVPGASASQGRSTDALTSSVDLFATIQALAGVDSPVASRGQPFLDADLNLFPEGERDYVLAEWEHPSMPTAASLRCIRTRDAKYVHYAGRDEGEYYDLQSDPLEFDNLFDDPTTSGGRTQLYDQLCEIYLSQRPLIPHEGGW
ncbi:MAG: sulfatase-like hydrolase/transferase [Phycisphaeraceae bacterium]